MRTMIIVMLFITALSTMFADTLIVTKDGQGIWASSVRQEGENVIYTDKSNGSEVNVSVADLHGVISTVKRGKQYTSGQIDKSIEKIQKLQTMHRNLLRQLNPILQEWEALKKPSPELESAIDEVVSAFKTSSKDTGLYKKTVLDLGMIRYKDVQGKYAPRIDSLVKEVGEEYVKTNKEKLKSSAQAIDSMTIDDFVGFKTLAGDVAKVAGDSDKEEVDKLLSDTRAKAYDALCGRGYKIFMADKSVDAYLESKRILSGVKEQIAETDAQKTAIDERLSTLSRMAAKAQPDFNIDENGFVFTRNDMVDLNVVGQYCSLVTFTGTDVNEQVFVLPERAPGSLQFGRPFSTHLRLVLNRGQPKDRELGVLVVLLSENGISKHTVPLGKLEFKDGQAKVDYKEDFSQCTIRNLAPNKKGQYCIYFYIAYQHIIDEANTEWVPISKACAWPIRP